MESLMGNKYLNASWKGIKVIDALVLLGFMFAAFQLNSSTIEVVAGLTGLVCVWLNAKENIWAYPIGIINLSLFFIIFTEYNLYADATLQVIFLVLSIYGWYIWLTKRDGHKVRPTRVMTRNEVIGFVVGTVVVTALWGYGLTTWTDASVPYADALIATMSIMAQFYLSRKVLQNWIIWIVVDVLSIGLYMYKGLDLIALTYSIFLVICIFGYIRWKAVYVKEQQEKATLDQTAMAVDQK